MVQLGVHIIVSLKKKWGFLKERNFHEEDRNFSGIVLKEEDDTMILAFYGVPFSTEQSFVGKHGPYPIGAYDWVEEVVFNLIIVDCTGSNEMA